MNTSTQFFIAIFYWSLLKVSASVNAPKSTHFLPPTYVAMEAIFISRDCLFIWGPHVTVDMFILVQLDLPALAPFICGDILAQVPSHSAPALLPFICGDILAQVPSHSAPALLPRSAQTCLLVIDILASGRLAFLYERIFKQFLAYLLV